MLNRLKLTDWIVNNPEETMSIFLTGFFEYHFEDKSCYDFMPFTAKESVSDYFQNVWDLDWLDVLSGKFYEDVELNIDTIAMAIEDHEPVMSREEIESYVLGWVREWCGNIRSAATKITNDDS